MPQLGEVNQPWLQVWQQAFPRPNFEETTNAQQSSGATWLLPAIAVGTTITTALLAIILILVIQLLT
jgi:hypothetical protein